MGTLLYSRGIPQRASLDELVAIRPGLIGAIHREYLAAGADLIETATFGANRVRLAPFGLADQAGKLARRGAQLAREARDVAGRDALVLGSIGPLGTPNRDLLHLGDAAIRRPSARPSTGSSRAGPTSCVRDVLSVEHLAIAVDEARASADLPIGALLTFGEELELPDGTTPGRRRGRSPPWTSTSSA